MLSRMESSLLLYPALGVFREASEDVRKASFPAGLSFFESKSRAHRGRRRGRRVRGSTSWRLSGSQDLAFLDVLTVSRV
jgi:hypothetical protein